MTKAKNSSAPRRKPKAPPAEPVRRGEARAIADLVPDVGRAAFRRFGFVQSAVVTRWAEIVGERYAEVSAPESIRFPVGKRAGGTLELSVSGAHAPLIQHVLPQIVERVNRFFGYAAVARVKLRHGLPPARRDPLPARPANPADAPRLGQELRGIADPELAEVLANLARGLASGSNR